MSLTVAKKITLCASQTYELLDAMEKDSGVKLDSLCVDGGVTKADTLLNIMAGVHNSLYFWFYFFFKINRDGQATLYLPELSSLYRFHRKPEKYAG